MADRVIKVKFTYEAPLKLRISGFNQGGAGDMTKAVYDITDAGIVDKSQSVDDGTYISTAQEVKDAVDKKHEHANKSLLDSYTQTNAELESAVDDSHEQNTDTILLKSEVLSLVGQQNLYNSINNTDNPLAQCSAVYSPSGFNIRKVSVGLNPSTVPVTTTITAELRPTQSPSGTFDPPTATILGTKSRTVTLTSTGFQWVDIEFDSSIFLAWDASQPRYAIVFYNTNVANAPFAYHDNGAGAYPNGRMWSWDGANWNLTNYGGDTDALCFRWYTVTSSAGEVINSGVIKENISADSGKTVDGRDISVDGSKLDTIESSAVSLPTVKSDSDISDAISKKHEQNTDLKLSCPNTEPTDGSINNNQVAFWVDEGTNIFKIKLKTSSGTIKTADISLS